MLSHPDVALGFALSAVLAADRGAQRALPGLGEQAARVAHEAIRLSRLSRSERDSAVQRLVEAGSPKAPVARAATEPSEARGLNLLTAADAKLSKPERLAASARSRPGFVPDRQLLRLLEATRKEHDAWGA